MNWIKRFFNNKQHDNRRQLKDVKRGDVITINYYKSVQKIIEVVCVSNDPQTKKILLQINWRIIGLQHIIMKYNDNAFSEFNLLNPIIKVTQHPIEQFDLATLQKKMNKALESERYEDADELQKQIDKIIKNF